MAFMILYAYLPYKKGGIERCENCTHNNRKPVDQSYPIVRPIPSSLPYVPSPLIKCLP